MLEMLKKIFNRGHGRFLEMLSDYVDGVLPEAERIALEAHLQGCDSCTEELESLRATVQMLRRMPEVEAPRSFRIAPAAVAAPTPPPERPVLLWAMRVSTALAVVAFTVMVAGNVTGLFGGGSGDGEQAADSPAASEPEPRDLMEESAATPTAIPAGIMQPTPEAMMQAEPDIIPKSTPMIMAERTATPEPEAMMEPTAMPDEEAASDTSVTVSEAADRSVGNTPLPQPTLAPVASAMPEPTPPPAPTSTPRPRPTTAPTPSPTVMPTITSVPTMDFRTRPDPTPTPEPWAWASSEEDDGGNGVVLGLTVGLGALAGALALGTIYLTLRRRRGVV